MDILIQIKQETPQWDIMVGKEHNELGYKIIVNSYDSAKKCLSISEFHDDYPYTSELVLFDLDKSKEILKCYGFDIYTEEMFSYSETTLYRMRGLEQAGFYSINYDYNTDKFMIDNMCELTFLKEDEKSHLIKARTKVRTISETPILISDIINGNI